MRLCFLSFWNHCSSSNIYQAGFTVTFYKRLLWHFRTQIICQKDSTLKYQIWNIQYNRGYLLLLTCIYVLDQHINTELKEICSTVILLKEIPTGRHLNCFLSKYSCCQLIHKWPDKCNIYTLQRVSFQNNQNVSTSCHMVMFIPQILFVNLVGQRIVLIRGPQRTFMQFWNISDSNTLQRSVKYLTFFPLFIFYTFTGSLQATCRV